MTNVPPAKVFIQIESSAEQQEHLRNTRKSLKVIQSSGTGKENLVGRPLLKGLKSNIETKSPYTPSEYLKRKKLERSTYTQTDSFVEVEASSVRSCITVEDLTSSESPGEHYWEILAEKRREALEITLVENRNLHNQIEGLEEELNTSRKMLEEAKNLVEVLTEMLNENEAENEVNQGASTSKDAEESFNEPSITNVSDEDDD